MWKIEILHIFFKRWFFRNYQNFHKVIWKTEKSSHANFFCVEHLDSLIDCHQVLAWDLFSVFQTTLSKFEKKSKNLLVNDMTGHPVCVVDLNVCVVDLNVCGRANVCTVTSFAAVCKRLEPLHSLSLSPYIQGGGTNSPLIVIRPATLYTHVHIHTYRHIHHNRMSLWST